MADGDRIPKVLVVDDEPNIRELVEVALKFHGCAVSVSASGKDALHQVGAYEPDLMILDVMLPDMDGFEVCRTLRVADLELDEDHWTVRRGGVPIDLSPTEFRLLAYLMRNQGRMLTRQQLLENVWGWEFAGQSQVVETYVSYLRRKLDPLGPPLIHTQRGVGYSLRPPPETEHAGR